MSVAGYSSRAVIPHAQVTGELPNHRKSFVDEEATNVSMEKNPSDAVCHGRDTRNKNTDSGCVPLVA